MYNIKIGSFNVEGALSVKCDNPEFVKIVKMFDIITIQETWLTTHLDINIPGYNDFRKDRVKSKKAKRVSGGVVVFFKQNLRPGIQKMKSECLDNI